MNMYIKSAFTILLVSVFISASQAQIEFGIKSGINSTDLAVEGTDIFLSGNEAFKVSLLEADYGFHFGFYSRLSLLGIFVEPSFLFNSSSSTYRIDGSNEGDVFTDIKKERFNNLDIPVMVGFKLLVFDIHAGPVAHIYINSASDLIDLPGYNERIKTATYGFQAGLGLNLWKLRLSANYEGNLSSFGEHLYIGEQPFNFDQNPARLLFTLGIKL